MASQKSIPEDEFLGFDLCAFDLTHLDICYTFEAPSDQDSAQHSLVFVLHEQYHVISDSADLMGISMPLPEKGPSR